MYIFLSDRWSTIKRRSLIGTFFSFGQAHDVKSVHLQADISNKPEMLFLNAANFTLKVSASLRPILFFKLA